MAHDRRSDRNGWRRAILTAVTVLAMVAACGPGTAGSVAPSRSPVVSLTTEEQAWLAKKGTLEIGAYADFPPYGFTDAGGAAAGSTIDLWNLVAARIGVKVRFTPVVFTELVDGVKSGRFDSVAGFLVLESRRSDFDFSTPFQQVTTYLYVDADLADRTTLASLEGSTVAVVKGDSSEVTATQAGLATLVVPDYEATLRAVADRRAQAVIMDAPVAAYYLKKDGLGDRIKQVGAPMQTGSVAFPVRKGESVLLGILDKALASIDPTEIEAILARWEGR